MASEHAERPRSADEAAALLQSRIGSRYDASIDSAPVMFTSGAQVKIYRGDGSDLKLPLRALARYGR
jgi:hypothetical protein